MRIRYEQIPEGTGFKRNGITWIASFPKSGNTWVRLFLSAYLNGTDNFSLQKRNFSGDSQMYVYQSVSPVPIQMLTDTETWRLRDAALSHQFYSSAQTNLILKTHTANAFVNNRWLIPKDLSHKTVYIVRDPRDVIVSWKRYSDESWDSAYKMITNESGRLYSKHPMAISTFVSSWDRHVESWTVDEGLDSIVIRYEDLVDRPETGFRAVLDYLEIPCVPDRFEDALDATSLDSLRSLEKEEGFVENQSKDTFFHKGGSRWTDELPIKYVDKIEKSFGDVMRTLNYL